MSYCGLRIVAVAPVLVALVAAVAMADEPKAGDGLVEFKSDEGKFSVRLPGKPEEEVVEVGAAKEKQHQFKIGSEHGMYLVSYQDNPNLKGASSKKIEAALEGGRDGAVGVFHGKLIESKSVTLDKKHPGLIFRVTIPDANGEARCRFYMVGTRLYQIMAIGEPDFANSEEASQVIESFKTAAGG